jgi:peptide/nickel transport system substrate-binding protein
MAEVKAVGASGSNEKGAHGEPEDAASTPLRWAATGLTVRTLPRGTLGRLPRRFRFVGPVAAASLLAFASGLAGLVESSPASAATGHASASTAPLVIDAAGDGGGPESLDPAVDYDNDGYTFLPLMYDTLVRPTGSSSVTMEPDLATSWANTDKGLTWTFHLRPNVKFHDGTPVNSSAVKFSFERVLSLKQGGWADFAAIKSIATPNPLTVVFHLNYPFYPFLEDVANAYGAEIVSPTAVQAHEVKGDLGSKWLYNHDAGSGPYELVRWTQNQAIDLKAFPGYWGGWKGSHVKSVIFDFNAVSSTVRLGLQNGSVDAAQGLSPTDISALAHGGSGVKVNNYTGSTVFSYLAFNTTWGPLQNPDVRLALADSVPTSEIAKDIYQGEATAMNSYAPAGIPGYVASPTPYSLNLSTARKLLKKAGYGHGFTLPAVYLSGQDLTELSLEAWQADLAKLNIKLSIKVMPYSEFAGIQNNPKTSPPVMINTWAEDYANSSNNVYFLWLYSKNSSVTGNFAFYKNPQVDKLLVEARGASSTTAALSLYKQILTITYPAAPYVPLVDFNGEIALGPNVHGYQYNLSLTPFYFDVYNMWVS